MVQAEWSTKGRSVLFAGEAILRALVYTDAAVIKDSSNDEVSSCADNGHNRTCLTLAEQVLDNRPIAGYLTTWS